MSPDPDNAFFANGVQEDILTNLSKIKDLLVISRSSTLRYRSPDRNLKEIGNELGVRYLVEGSVRRAGNQVRVSIQLIDTQTDGHLWAENYNRDLHDIFAIQASIAKEIAGKLQTILSPREIEMIDRRPTENQEAYDHYLRYRELVETTSGVRWTEKIEALEKALALDPSFAEAWASLAVNCYLEYRLGDSSDPEHYLTLADQALETAISLSPGSPDTLHAQSFHAWLKEADFEKSIGYFLQILTLDPGFFNAHRMLGQHYLGMGRLTEAQYHYEKEYRRDPLSPWTNELLFRCYMSQKLWDKARSLAQLNAERLENSGTWKEKAAYTNYLQDGDLDAYVSALKGISSDSDNIDLKIKHALFSRNLSSALELLSQREPQKILEFFVEHEGYLLPQGTLASLLQFELGNREDASRLAREGLLNLQRYSDRQNNLLNPGVVSLISIHHALLEDPEAMEASIGKSKELRSTVEWNFVYQQWAEIYIAIAYLVQGDHDKAMDTLEAVSNVDGIFIVNRELDRWFIFDRLRGNPRFEALLQERTND